MSVRRIWAVLLQELLFSRRSVEIAFDLPFFSIMSVVVFGLFARFLDSVQNSLSARYLLVGILLWEILRITQYSISVAALWNIWSRNLSNMFVTPLSLSEYIAAQMISGVLKMAAIFSVLAVIAAVLYDFNILQIGGLNFLFFSINLTLFGWSLGMILLGVILLLGTRVQAVAWGLIALFQPLTAAFFPLSVLPSQFQTFARVLPPTHVFEGARAALIDPSFVWSFHSLALMENVLYLAASLLFLRWMFKASKVSGQFARNEQ